MGWSSSVGAAVARKNRPNNNGNDYKKVEDTTTASTTRNSRSVRVPAVDTAGTREST